MNDRIKLLVEQATAKISFRLDPNTYKHIDDPDGALERFKFDKQKFAELILAECISQCWTVSELEHKGNVISECSKRMRKHFGVEA